jgi:DNA-binding transcriptional regulator YdaS (Cro superfamily)
MALTGMDLLRSQPGTLGRIARELGVTRAAVTKWDEIPLHRVPDVERITGYSRKALRPDFPWAEPASINQD